MLDLARKVALEKRIKLQTGTYVAVTGPNYETRAELRFLARMAGDAVGMSTVPEVIVARHAGLEHILGISVVTDMATGEFKEQVTHDSVIQAAAAAGPRFVELVREVIRRL
jgi:purine-nucleoside phosphorylase